MKAQYHQRQHSFGPHAQLRLQGEAGEIQEMIEWCMGNLPQGTWDHQAWSIGKQSYLQVDSVDPSTIMLLKLTYG